VVRQFFQNLTERKMLKNKNNISKLVDLRSFQTFTASGTITDAGTGVDVELTGKNMYL